MIEFKNVTKSYSVGNTALNGVSMKIEDGEFVFLVGPSGSGKSTIIRLITGELSGGEQQRLAIARALVNNPSTIIADEPTGNLDPARSYEIMALLQEINRLGTTMLVVTHEMDLVQRFSNRVIMIDDGLVVSDGVGEFV